MKIKLLLTVFAITHQLFPADRLPRRDTHINLEAFVFNETLINRLNTRVYRTREQILLQRLFVMQDQILMTSPLFMHESPIIYERIAFLQRLFAQQQSSDDKLLTIKKLLQEKKRRSLLIQRILQENFHYRSVEQLLFDEVRRNIFIAGNEQRSESGQRRQRTDSSELSQATTVLLSQNGSPAPSISPERLFSQPRSISRSLSSSDQTPSYHRNED
jgi:hypothetical protein